MPIVVENGINIGPGITIHNGAVVGPTLLLELDAANYSGSGSTWTAATGSNATLYMSPAYTASSPTYFTFDPGDVEYASVPNIGNLSTWTVEAWFRVNSTLTGTVTSVICNEFDLTTNLNFSIGTNSAPGSYNICVGYWKSGNWYTTSGFAPSIGTWYYVVGTYDGSTIKQYNNGVINTTISGGPTPASGGEVRIARRWDSSDLVSSNFFPGDIAITRVYSGAKDATAVTASWNADKARFGY